MATKTVERDGSVVMAALAEVGLTGTDTVGGLAGMAFNTTLQAVLARADAAAQSINTLMFQQQHVVAAHECRVLDTLSSTGGLNHRLWHTPAARTLGQSRPAGYRQQRSQEQWPHCAG